MTSQPIAFLGAGNVAWHLAPALQAAGLDVSAVYSRDLDNARALAERLPAAEPTDSLDFRESDARTFFLCIPDGAFDEALPALRLPEGAALLHTSGSQPMGLLWRGEPKNVGVFYPLQTFSKAKPVDFKRVPFCLESEDKALLQDMETWASALSERVQRIDSAERRILHVAAVMACNFSNHLLAVSEDVLQREGLSFDMLRPLVEETVQKAMALPPKEAQTGPARRGDAGTLAWHAAYLKEKTPYGELYEVLSESIRRMYAED